MVRAVVPIVQIVALVATVTAVSVVTVVAVVAVVAAVAAVAAVPIVALVAAVAAVAVVALVVAGTVGVAYAFGAFGAFGVFGLVVAFVAGFAVSAREPQEAVMVATFVLLVPVTNAMLDHASVQASRGLLADLVARRGAARQSLMMAGHVVADVVLAVLCLVGLAILLPAVLQAANHVFSAAGLPAVEWVLYLDAARDDPFGKGLLVTGMLATTLIPTVLHLLAAGGALALPAVGEGYIRALADKTETTLLQRAGFVGLILVSVFLSWMILAVAGVILWEALATFVGPFGGYLADLAEYIGRAIGGPGAPVL